MIDGTQDWKLLGSAVVGAVAFPSLLGAFQHAIFKPLKLSFNLKYTTSLLGCASVTLASYGASWASLRVIHILRGKDPTLQDLRWSLIEPELFLSTVGSVIMFRALGGKYKAVLPSNLIHPGAFAREWVPALKESQLASTREKSLLKSMGERYGCHTCGKKRMTEFVADHQPPSKVVGNHISSKIIPVSDLSNPLLQRFYPQCKKCSNCQGGLLSTSKNPSQKRKAFVTHASSLRVYHIFLPLPLVIFCTKEYLSQQNREQGAIYMSRATSTQTIVSPRSTDQSEKPAAKLGEKIEGRKQEEDLQKRLVKVGEGKKRGARQVVGLLDGDLLSGFPLLIMWQKVVRFLESFSSRVDAFHLTLWTFSIIAALGTM